MAGGFYARAEIQQAMDLMVGERLRGRAAQDILELSTVKNYVIGARMRLDGRIFRYSYAAGDLAGLARLVINSNYAPGVTGHANEDGFEGGIGFAAAVGATYLDIADTALRAADYYQGGHLIVFGDTIFHQHYIVKSDAGNGTYVRLYLDKPVAVEAITVAMGCSAYRSPYSAVMAAQSTQQEFEPFVGVNLKPVASGNYFWLQTAGPAFITPMGVVWPGSAAHLRDVFAWMDGTIQPGTQADPSLGYQRVGYLLTATGGTAADYGDALINLQLDQ